MRSMLLFMVLVLSSGLSWAADPPVAAAEAAAQSPGDVVMAAVAAQRSGDFEQWKQTWHPRIWEGKEAETRSMLERLREFSPTSERVLDVKVDGDKAVVTIEVNFDGNTSAAPVDLERHEGRWRVTRM